MVLGKRKVCEADKTLSFHPSDFLEEKRRLYLFRKVKPVQSENEVSGQRVHAVLEFAPDEGFGDHGGYLADGAVGMAHVGVALHLEPDVAHESDRHSGRDRLQYRSDELIERYVVITVDI